MAAAIIAKVARDAELDRLDAQFPGYGLGQAQGLWHAAAFESLARTRR